ncbi:T9SS type A sorting domain-containing protein [Paraflavisolibacter sp. H34]|uniref:right-handed parallel beta-helix repeat-containing protein n=1 Tax=Huijunlia imazamoxiresistens TaxID=3127457 RepID=UPI003017E8DD
MLRNLLFLAVFLCSCSLVAHSKTYYVAPAGDDANAGTIDAPFLTVQRAQTAVAAGDTVYIRGGLYLMQEAQIALLTTVGTTKFAYVTNLTKSGASGKRINYWAYPGERPVFDYSNVKPADTRINAFEVTGSWLHLRGLEVVGVQVTTNQNINTQSICFSNNASSSTGGSNNIYEQLSMHDGMAIGFYLTRGGNNLVVNCDAYNNRDSISGDKLGGNVDGFGAHPNRDTYTGNVFRGCRAWYNSDDGYDCINSYAAITFENCWSFRNGYSTSGQSLANGLGFKVGGFGVSTPPSGLTTVPRHTVRYCLAVYNKASGFYANHHMGGNDWYNNTAYRNSTNFNMLNRSQDFSQDVPGYGHVLRNNISYAPRSSNAFISDYDAAQCTIDHNSFLSTGLTLNSSDFRSLDTSLFRTPRLANGDLPVTDLLRLAAGSDLINAGVNVGLPFAESAPDLGYLEYTPAPPAATVTSIKRLAPAEAITTANYVVYRVVFSEPVTGVDAGDFILTGTGTVAGSVASINALADGKTYEVGVNVVTRGGYLRLEVIAAPSIRNFNGDALAGGFGTGERYILDKFEQTITFAALEEKGYGDADFDAGATATSGLPIAYTSSNPEVAEIVDGKVHIKGLGTTLLAAAQDGNQQFEAAPAVVQTLTVTDKKAPGQPQALTVTKTADGKVGLMWQASGDDIGVTGYYVFLNGKQLNEQPLTATTYITDAPAGSLVYAFTVIAADAAGNLSTESATALFSNSNGNGGANSSLEILKVFPNPNEGNFKVRLNSKETGTVNTCIYNSNGVLVQSVSEGKSGDVYQHQFNLQGVQKGMYLVRVAVGAFVQSSIVMIQ